MKISIKLLKILEKDNRFSLVLTGIVFVQIITFITYSSSSWLADMAISFAPYSVVVSVLLLLVGGVLFRPRMKNASQGAALVVTMLIIVINFIPIYSWLFATKTDIASKSELRLASFNKLVVNDDFNALRKEINPDNYDLVAVSEIKEEDYFKISPDWKYSYITSCDCDPAFGVEIALFSNYEIKSPKTLAANDGYGVMLSADVITVSGRNSSLRINAVHPPAPVSSKEFKRRNAMLRNVIAPAVQQQKASSVLVGDMNLSPYSASYVEFTEGMDAYTNAGNGNTVFRTWCLGEFDLACAPIDHIFVTSDIAVRNFQVKAVDGSDHYLVSTDIMLK